MANRSFAYRASFKTVLLAAVLFVITIILIAVGGGKIVEHGAVDYTRQSLGTSMRDVQSVIYETEYTAAAIAMSAEESYRNGAFLDSLRGFSLLDKTLVNNPGFLGCGFYFEPYRYDGINCHSYMYANREPGSNEISHEWGDEEEFLSDGWECYTRDWYYTAVNTGKPSWKSPFLEYFEISDEDKLVSTYSYPMTDADGVVFGIFTIDLYLDWIYDKLVEMRPYSKSNVVIADSSLNVICNPLAEKPFEGSLYDVPFIPQMSLTAVHESGPMNIKELAGNSGSVSVHSGGHGALLVADVMDNGWIICVSSLFEDVFADLISLWLIIIALAFVTLILLFFLNRHTIRKLAAPIKDFATAASKITDGRFDIPIPEVNTGDELTELGNALSFMQKSVTDYIEQLKSTTAEKERLKSELDVARNIQSQMLNRQFPKLEKAGIYADSIPAREVGGDLFDFFVNDNELYFIIGDVSGKGVPAALLMAITIAAFRATGKKGHSPVDIVSLINDTFCRSNDDMMFVTAVVGKIDMNTGLMEFCNAGHNPMLVISPDGHSQYIHAKRNLVCGVMEGFAYEGETYQLQTGGSRLIIYTDGITEAEDRNKALYGEDRLMEWANSQMPSSQNDLQAVDGIVASVRKFTDGAVQNDDITLMSISI